jgi:trigger factor
LGELREKVREDLIARAKREADGRVRQGLLDMVLERNPVEVPESLVDRELRSLEAQAAFINQARGMNREEAVERARSSRDELKGQAERRARSQLILDAIADQEKIEVTDDEVAEQVARLVQQERDRETAANYYAKEEHREALKQSMQREKTLEHLISRAQQEQQEEALGESASES